MLTTEAVLRVLVDNPGSSARDLFVLLGDGDFQKKHVNVILYRLLRQGRVSKNDFRPPKWRVLELRTHILADCDNPAVDFAKHGESTQVYGFAGAQYKGPKLGGWILEQSETELANWTELMMLAHITEHAHNVDVFVINSGSKAAQTIAKIAGSRWNCHVVILNKI